MPKQKRRLIVHISDEHSGHKLGLCNPETVIQEESGKEKQFELTETQKEIWDLHTSNADKLAGMNDKQTDIVILHTGEPTHGDRHNKYLMSQRISDQVDISVMNYEPLFSRCKNIKMMRYAMGTDDHNFGEGSAEITMSKILGLMHKGLDCRAVYHGLLDIDGFEIDYAHKGPTKALENG